MKANELMIGDWLQYADGNKKGTIVGIKCDPRYLEQEARLMLMDYNGKWHEKELDDTKPIPITPEILEKNGFVNDEEKEIGCRYHKLIPTWYEKNSYTIQVTFYKEPIMGVNILFKCWGWVPPENGGINDIHICSIKIRP